MLAEKRYLAVSIDLTASSSSIFRAVSSEGAQKIFGLETWRVMVSPCNFAQHVLGITYIVFRCYPHVKGFCRMAEKKKASTRKPAAKLSVLGVRLEPAMRAALDKCAAADERPISVMAHKIIADYLRGNGWLK